MENQEIKKIIKDFLEEVYSYNLDELIKKSYVGDTLNTKEINFIRHKIGINGDENFTIFNFEVDIKENENKISAEIKANSKFTNHEYVLNLKEFQNKLENITKESLDIALLNESILDNITFWSNNIINIIIKEYIDKFSELKKQELNLITTNAINYLNNIIKPIVDENNCLVSVDNDSKSIDIQIISIMDDIDIPNNISNFKINQLVIGNVENIISAYMNYTIDEKNKIISQNIFNISTDVRNDFYEITFNYLSSLNVMYKIKILKLEELEIYDLEYDEQLNANESEFNDIYDELIDFIEQIIFIKCINIENTNKNLQETLQNVVPKLINFEMLNYNSNIL